MYLCLYCLASCASQRPEEPGSVDNTPSSQPASGDTPQGAPGRQVKQKEEIGNQGFQPVRETRSPVIFDDDVPREPLPGDLRGGLRVPDLPSTLPVGADGKINTER